jgi:phosphatidylglycerol---prolipoprotein diacylglyceryl transferase
MVLTDFVFDPYPIIVAVGVVLALVLLDAFFKKNHIKKGMSTDYEILFVIAIAIGFVFAILFQNFYDFLENPSTYTWTWAMTFFGGFIGGFASFFLGWFLFLRKKYPSSMAAVTTIAGGCVPLAHGIGRIGCTVDGCCYGIAIPTDSPFYWMGMTFPSTNGVKVVPTQLIEAIFLILLSCILLFFAFKKKTLLTLPIYFVCYGVFRFSIEFLRGDHRGSLVPGLSPSQFWALLLFLFGIVYIVILCIKKKTNLSSWNIQTED